MLGTEGFAQCRLNIGRTLDFHPDVPVGFCQLDEIGQSVPIGFSVTVAVEHLLPLPHHAQIAVIEIDDLDRQTKLFGCR